MLHQNMADFCQDAEIAPNNVDLFLCAPYGSNNVRSCLVENYFLPCIKYSFCSSVLFFKRVGLNYFFVLDSCTLLREQLKVMNFERLSVIE